MGISKKSFLMRCLQAMSRHYGPTHWWPGDSPLEVAVGAILTQNTAWTSVEKAIANLKRGRLLSVRALRTCPMEQLHAALRPSGYFRQKAERVRTFCEYLTERYGGSMKRMARQPMGLLREELLAIRGIGPETADDILLYACDKPVFVVDAYTRRIFSRHGLAAETLGYEELRALFEEALPHDLALFKEYHGLIVWTGKDFCRPQARCTGCPLEAMARTDTD